MRTLHAAAGVITGITVVAAVAIAGQPPVYEGSAINFVRQYKADVDGFGSQYNTKTVHLTGAAVQSVTLPDAKSGAPWLISLRDETGSGSTAHVSCFVSNALPAAQRERALAVKPLAHIDVVAEVAADGYSLGLTDCTVVARGLVMLTGTRTANASTPEPMQQQPAVSPLSIVVTNAWNDTINGVLFVHVAVSITGGAQDVSLQPDDFGLSMQLVNGAKKVFPSIRQAAPTYQKVSLLDSGNLTTAYEVDPKQDLGAIGPMTIPAHGGVRIVVTFEVADSVMNSSDNRAVSLR